jgi:hypothetical protein
MQGIRIKGKDSCLFTFPSNKTAACILLHSLPFQRSCWCDQAKALACWPLLPLVNCSWFTLASQGCLIFVQHLLASYVWLLCLIGEYSKILCAHMTANTSFHQSKYVQKSAFRHVGPWLCVKIHWKPSQGFVYIFAKYLFSQHHEIAKNLEVSCIAPWKLTWGGGKRLTSKMSLTGITTLLIFCWNKCPTWYKSC